MSKPRVAYLNLRRFRSHVGNGLGGVILNDITFLVGQNAAGKSNFLDALALFSEVVNEPLISVVDRRGGFSALRSRTPGAEPHDLVNLAITFRGETTITYGFSLGSLGAYGFEVAGEMCLIGNEEGGSFLRTPNIFDSSIAGFHPNLSETALVLPILGGVRPFSQVTEILGRIRIYAIDPQKLREAHPADEGTILARDGSNAASVVRRMRLEGTWPRVMDFLQAAVPQIHDVEAEREGPKLGLKFTQRTAGGDLSTFQAYEMSDGTLRLLGLLVALLQEPRPVLIGIEEPEVHIHPGALGVVLDAIRFVSDSTQVVVTTQSADLLDADWIEPEDIRIVKWSGGISTVSNLPEGAAETLRRHLRTPGQLLRSGALSGAS